jgi:hypothetical protein
MNTRFRAGLVLSVVACLSAGYGLGSGWIRLGPPGRETGVSGVASPDGPAAPAIAARPGSLPVPLLDGEVIRAQAPAAVPAPPTPNPPTPAASATRIVEIREADPEGGTTLIITRDFSQPVPLRQSAFTVVIDSPDTAAQVTIGGALGNQSIQGVQDTNNKALFYFGAPSGQPVPLTGAQPLVLTTGGNALPAPNSRVDVIVPTGRLAAPSITGWSNNADIEPPDTGLTSPVPVYGHYLKLNGQDATSSQPSDLRFFVYVQDSASGSSNYVLLGAIPNPTTQINADTRTWTSTLTLPDLPLSSASWIYAVGKAANDQGFSKKLIVQRNPLAFVQGAAPTIDAIWKPDSPLPPATPVPFPLRSDPVGPRYYVNKSQVIFHGTGAKTNTRVLIYADGQSTPIAQTDLLGKDGPWYTNPSNTLPDNTYTVRATMSQGDEPKQFSPPVTFLVGTQGPSLDSVAFNPPGPEVGVQRLVIRFKGNVLDTTAAENTTNYTLLGSNGTGAFNATDSSNKATIVNAAYSPQTNTVTLQSQSLKADDYQLTVTSSAAQGSNPAQGLTDAYGNTITGVLSKIVSKPPDEGGVTVDAIPKPEKAPNAVFPEFNNPRPPTNGFNPSDHVETRVARLYYYRDARRVAAIINRDLKSYNQAAVDTRRRLAEKARSSADTLTDQRRQQEVKAVRAAQASRDAQRQLEQAQAALQQSQATINNVGQSLPLLQSQQASLQQQLAEAQAAAGAPPAGTTPGTPTPTQSAAAAAVTTINNRLGAVTLQISEAQTQASQAAGQIGTQTAAVQAAQANLQSLRALEAQASDDTLVDQQKEDRAREGQFRLEVAAAQEDPNSYVPGDPKSIDPVLQVSISVIGEGLLQLRGPIKGINIIRRMIDEIDTPAGQVRVALHTVQINGEREKRMEKVAARIQYYVDHARFLTVQSSQVLRNAVVKVASQKAEQACAEPLPDKIADPEKWAVSQQLRDRKYQEAFFGTDFINELHEIDAEFLHTGNKLLSLNSMDTTSLASALYLLALAKNETRLEILEQFKADLATKLPEAEANYTLAAGRIGEECHNQVQPLAQNAQFQSFLGFFNAEVAGNDTLNPLQREFIKLAQILKSRIVTELEYNQRFKERGLIEDRLGDYLTVLKEQKKREDQADRALAENRRTLHGLRTRMVNQLNSVTQLIGDDNDNVQNFKDEIEETVRAINRIVQSNRDLLAKRLVEVNVAQQFTLSGTTYQLGQLKRDDAITLLPSLTLDTDIRKPEDVPRVIAQIALINRLIAQPVELVKFTFTLHALNKHFRFRADDKGTVEPEPNTGTTADDLKQLTSIFQSWYNRGTFIRYLTTQFNLPAAQREFATQASILLDSLLADVKSATPQLSRDQIIRYANMLVYYAEIIEYIRYRLDYSRAQTQDIAASLGVDAAAASGAVAARWRSLKSTLEWFFSDNYKAQAAPVINQVDAGFQDLFEANVNYQNALEFAKISRRPLDAKKLLDMLIDDIEDKYIELLEGTRSHTANIDGYVKAIATALDDDFNTQFYYPAFAEIRKSSTYWDVTLGQVETTNILTNNRMFAKVEPQATMEFDLPKRDILINEAMNGALAMTKDFGALVADPNFLALTKLKSGQPTASPAQGFGGGASTVRNVLPGLPRSNDEQPLSQAPAGDREFGSAMEALIPDPAIYKFETGTGFEIRPVIQPDGQSVVFHLDYMYTTNIREPVRADEKHLGRVKRHFIDTEVQLGNYELREVSRYTVALKAARTSRGVPLFEDIPGLGILFRPLPSASSSLQQNVILAQSTIFPTLFDLMGLRIAPTVADLDTLRLRNSEFLVRGRARDVSNRVFDYSTSSVDEFLRIPPAERRPDLYRTQETIPNVHPDGYQGPGLNLHDSQLQEGYDPTRANSPSRYVPSGSIDSSNPTMEGSPGAFLIPPRRPGRDTATARASAPAARPRGPLPAPGDSDLPPLPPPAPVGRAARYGTATIPAPRTFRTGRPSATAPSRTTAAPTRPFAPRSTGGAPGATPEPAPEGTTSRRGLFSRLRGTNQ